MTIHEHPNPSKALAGRFANPASVHFMERSYFATVRAVAYEERVLTSASKLTLLHFAVKRNRKMSEPIYKIERLDGYTDGKPSWRKQFVPGPWFLRDRATATQEMQRLQQQNPNAKYRVRKDPKHS